jgi:hypothetical protein
MDQAQKAALANMPPRFLRLQALESWALGTQYDGRPDWWNGDCPVWERKPCVRYPAVKIAIQSNSDLVLGEGRFPTPTTKPEEDEDEDDESSNDSNDDSVAASADTDTADNGLSEDDSDVFDRFIREYHKISRFRAHCRESFEAAQAASTAVALHGHRNGKPFNELIPAKWCTPQLDSEGVVLALEIRYPYFEEYKQPDGKWAVRCKLYRRTLDETTDITYAPADADDQGTEPNWRAQTTIAHGLGFCPAIWYPFMKGSGPFNQLDGHAIHAGFEDQVQGLDIALSQKHRCALLSEPQPVEIGVIPGTNPTAEMGRAANVPSTEHGGPQPGSPSYTGGDPGRATGSYMYDSPARAARKKGPGFIWSYPNEKTSVEMLAFPDSVLKGMQDHCEDLLQKLEESLAVVFPKPGQFKGTGVVSGRAIEQSKQRQYDRCDKYRDDFGDRFINPSIDMQLRIALKAREQLRVPGIKQALPILDRFDQPTADPNAVAAA